MDLTPIFNIPDLCHRHGVKYAVISPGSRNAALTISFARHSEIECLSVPDERSAAFIGLGLSLASRSPVVMICTSGSAGLNYAPAVAEAYFNQVPLIILTADRPPELIGKRDGQTIFQNHMYGRHVKDTVDFPSFSSSPEKQYDCIRKILLKSATGPSGPVHINIPFREPFYPESDQMPVNSNGLTPKPSPTQNQLIDSKIWEKLKGYRQVVIVIGQSFRDDRLHQSIQSLSQKNKIPVVADVISNTQTVHDCITFQDLILSNPAKELEPDLIITCGLSVLSKNLKLFLKSCEQTDHWHVTAHDDSADTYGLLSKTVLSDAATFFNEYSIEQQLVDTKQAQFYEHWQVKNDQARKVISKIDHLPWAELNIYHQLISRLPNGIDLHLANSMAVRYVNTLSLHHKDISVYCNRGTSGIDGSNSTAVGTCFASGNNTLLLSGDVSFLYDRNAFWHNHLPNNLKIVIFNNSGGGIFRMINGPSSQPELKEFFETDQRSNAKFVAQEFGFEYYHASERDEFDAAIEVFFDWNKRSVLEVFTDAEDSKNAYKQLFKRMTNETSNH